MRRSDVRFVEKKPFRRDKIERILIRGIDYVGDLVLAIPALRGIRENFPEAYVAVALSPWSGELLSLCPYVDEVIEYDIKGKHKGLASQLRFIRYIRSRRFDLALLLTGNVNAAILAYLSGIPYRVGYDYDHRGWLLTTAVHDENDRRYRVEKIIDVTRAIGVEPRDKSLELWSSPGDEAWADSFLGERGALGAPLIVGFNPGSVDPARCWFEERYAELGDRLVREYGARIIVFGSPRERYIAETIESLMEERAIDAVGQTSLTQLLALIKRCHIFITGDTGPMHIALASRGPRVIALFGPSDEVDAFPPEGPHIKLRRGWYCDPCVRGRGKRRDCEERDCFRMRAITVEDVLEAMEEILE
ncbi:MAG: lipopolysaccharide heptosyltransferase II [bacterium]